AGDRLDRGPVDAASVGERVRVLPGQERSELLEAVRVLPDEVWVGPALVNKGARQCIQQSNVAAGFYGQEYVGGPGGHRPARVGDDDLAVGVSLACRLDAIEKDRVGLRNVAADDEDDIGVIDILVAARRAIAAQAAAVAGHG